MSLAAVEAADSGASMASQRPWWSRTKTSDKLETSPGTRSRPRSKSYVADADPSAASPSASSVHSNASSSRLQVLAAAFSFGGRAKSKAAKRSSDTAIPHPQWPKAYQNPSYATIQSPSGSTRRREHPASTISSFSRDDRSSEGPPTPASSSLVTRNYSPSDMAQESDPSPSLVQHHTVDLYSEPGKPSRPHIRTRAISELKGRPKTSSGSPVSPMGGDSLLTTSPSPAQPLVTSRHRSASNSTCALSRNGSTMSYFSSDTSAQSDRLPQRSGTRLLPALPHPKEPPSHQLPPPPTEEISNVLSNYEVPAERKERKDKASHSRFIPLSLRNSRRTSSKVDEEIPYPDNPESHDLATLEEASGAFVSNNTCFSPLSSHTAIEGVTSREADKAESSEKLKGSKRQQALHQTQSSGSLRPSLRHVSSFTPPPKGDTVTTSCPARPQQPQRQYSALSSDQGSLLSSGSSRVVQTPLIPPTVSQISRSTTVEEMDTNNTTPLPAVSRHILPPEEILRLMDTSTELLKPNDAQSEGSARTTADSASVESSLANSADIERRYVPPIPGLNVLRAPPRRGRKQPKLTLTTEPSRDTGSVNGRILAGPASLLQSNEPTPIEESNALHRSASFLALDDDLDTKPRGSNRVNSAGWESDSGEEESFFDFGRGRSMDSNDVLSD